MLPVRTTIVHLLYPFRLWSERAAEGGLGGITSWGGTMEVQVRTDQLSRVATETHRQVSRGVSSFTCGDVCDEVTGRETPVLSPSSPNRWLTASRFIMAALFLYSFYNVCVESDAVGSAGVPDRLWHVNVFEYSDTCGAFVFDLVAFTPSLCPEVEEGLAPCWRSY